MKLISSLFFLFLSLSLFSQHKVIKGKVIGLSGDLKGITVVNLSQETQTYTDSLGGFSIAASTDDLLIVSALHIRKARHVVEESDFINTVVIPVEESEVMLDVVEITRYDIDEVKLGIVPAGIKTYTVAERRLRKARTESVIVQAINKFNGKDKYLLQMVAIEKELTSLKKLDDLFDDHFYINKLGIENDLIGQFKVYLIQQPSFSYILKVNNKDLIKSFMFRMVDPFKKTTENIR